MYKPEKLIRIKELETASTLHALGYVCKKAELKGRQVFMYFVDNKETRRIVDDIPRDKIYVLPLKYHASMRQIQSMISQTRDNIRYGS